MKKILKFTFLAVTLFASANSMAGVSKRSFGYSNSTFEEKLFPEKTDFANSFSSNSILNPPPGGGDKAFEKQKIIFTFGYGFGNFGSTFLKLLFEGSDVKIKTLGPFHFRGEVGLTDGFGFGVSVNYIQNSASWTGDSNYFYKWTFSNTSILARMNFHMSGSETFDPYLGIGVGFKQGKLHWESTDPFWDADELISGSFQPFGMEITGGFRYYFTPNIGMYIELGLAKSLFQGGLAIGF